MIFTNFRLSNLLPEFELVFDRLKVVHYQLIWIWLSAETT